MPESLMQFLFANCFSLSPAILLQFTLKVNSAAKNCKKKEWNRVSYFWSSGSFKLNRCWYN